MMNLDIYNQLRSVPSEAQKSFSNGRFSGTDINPMWRIKRMTELFGACGFGWYYDVVSREIVTSPDGTMCAFVAIKLYVKQNDEWSKPIYGEGGNSFATKTKQGYVQTSDEAYKMALTDAVSNATKQLGLGADIWFERDKDKYTKSEAKSEEDTALLAAALQEVKACRSVESLKDVWQSYEPLQNSAEFKKAVAERKKELSK